MKLTPDQVAALQALVKNFKCPVCGNTHIDFNDEVLLKPLYEDENLTNEQWLKIAVGHCRWCGLVTEFDLDKVMASYAIMTKK